MGGQLTNTFTVHVVFFCPVDLAYPPGGMLLQGIPCRDEERLSGLQGRFLARPFSFSPVRLTRFHQDQGWLSCLRSPTFSHLFDPCFTGLYASVNLADSPNRCTCQLSPSATCGSASQVHPRERCHTNPLFPPAPTSHLLPPGRRLLLCLRPFFVVPARRVPDPK